MNFCSLCEVYQQSEKLTIWFKEIQIYSPNQKETFTGTEGSFQKLTEFISCSSWDLVLLKGMFYRHYNLLGFLHRQISLCRIHIFSLHKEMEIFTMPWFPNALVCGRTLQTENRMYEISRPQTKQAGVWTILFLRNYEQWK